jgi:hypothetical protein
MCHLHAIQVFIGLLSVPFLFDCVVSRLNAGPSNCVARTVGCATCPGPLPCEEDEDDDEDDDTLLEELDQCIVAGGKTSEEIKQMHE